jgi:hypothetical protein
MEDDFNLMNGHEVFGVFPAAATEVSSLIFASAQRTYRHIAGYDSKSTNLGNAF